MRTTIAILAICTLGAQATEANASTIAGTATGSFGSFNPGNSTATATIDNTGPDTFSFGGAIPSYVTFNGEPDFTGDYNAPFAIGDVTALKNPTTTYPSTGTSVVLTTTLSFNAPVITTKTLTFTLDIGLFPGLVTGTTDADIFGITDIYPAIITVGTQRYDLALIGFDPDGETNDISLQEGVPYTGQLFAELTPDLTPIQNAVPEPASLLLLTLPLLATLRRRGA